MQAVYKLIRAHVLSPFLLMLPCRGFCYFNSVAIAAKLLQQRLSVSKTLVVDWVSWGDLGRCQLIPTPLHTPHQTERRQAFPPPLTTIFGPSVSGNSLKDAESKIPNPGRAASSYQPILSVTVVLKCLETGCWWRAAAGGWSCRTL